MKATSRKVRTKESEFMSDETFADLKEPGRFARFERGERHDLNVR